jgi:hypothetical protein
MTSTYYKPGQWNVVCDRCGQEFKSGELRKTWDGLWVCDKDFEVRHPQDFIRGVPDYQAPPFTRPENPDGTSQVAYAASITVDVTTNTDFIISVLTGNTTINSPLSPTTNKIISFSFTQDTLGNRTVTWNAVFTGVTLPASGKHNETTSIQFRYNGTNWVQLSQPIWI